MRRVCILTDNSVEFTRQGYAGNELVFTFPFSVQSELPQHVKARESGNEEQFGLEPPPINEILKLFRKLHQDHSEILVITLSSALSSLSSVVEKAIGQYGDLGSIQTIDSHTTSIGLGMLVQMAAELASLGTTSQEIEQQLRISIPHIYSLLCLPDLSYLASANFLSPAQAVVGEMLDVLPIFSLENGCLTCIQKVRTHRHLLETFQEFVDEFIDPFYVAIINNANHLRTTTFRDYLITNFPRTSFGEHILGTPLFELLGPRSIGLIVIENNLRGTNENRVSH
ncbi:MAG: hypothetical protein A2X25_08170 [Chloroflexi bacterium GWB2_49_20]|nr:MAG: hypothetical protein A2X25_08170 [Chloroflexi bacterium GWB2_49_20]OGN79588.1 MAG: hypothetical protein A2X26_05855 [Chloroflexi bacterium GWC2_49_37]OGN84489.1 MAG: hypothetical protein A2X27_10675 [Chloroflexi bacterium GWD2_49_16]HBG74089.1 hypothetical protein [Anaerolineae bacterium]HCC78891.1 hypothetical protein [Anaerolineae bacterium]